MKAEHQIPRWEPIIGMALQDEELRLRASKMIHGLRERSWDVRDLLLGEEESLNRELLSRDLERVLYVDDEYGSLFKRPQSDPPLPSRESLTKKLLADRKARLSKNDENASLGEGLLFGCAAGFCIILEGVLVVVPWLSSFEGTSGATSLLMHVQAFSITIVLVLAAHLMLYGRNALGGLIGATGFIVMACALGCLRFGVLTGKGLGDGSTTANLESVGIFLLIMISAMGLAGLSSYFFRKGIECIRKWRRAAVTTLVCDEGSLFEETAIQAEEMHRALEAGHPKNVAFDLRRSRDDQQHQLEAAEARRRDKNEHLAKAGVKLLREDIKYVARALAQLEFVKKGERQCHIWESFL